MPKEKERLIKSLDDQEEINEQEKRKVVTEENQGNLKVGRFLLKKKKVQFFIKKKYIYI